MEHSYNILDEENGVASCCIAEIPQAYREDIEEQSGKLTKLTFYFDKEHDLVVLNEDNQAFEYYADIVLDLMNCTDEELLYVYHELSEESRAGFSNLFTILIAVKRYRVLAKKLGHSEV